MRLPTLAAALLAATALPVPAQQQMKPGLWEVQTKAGGNPKMDQAMAQMQQQMAAMSPEQRKQMEAMMASRGVQMGQGANGAMAVKMCITKEMAERHEVSTHRGDCKTTSNQRSGNLVKVAFSCSNPPSTGESQLTMSGPEAFSSHTTVTSSRSGKPETMTIDSSGKWLGADCGSVKPIQPRP